MRRCSPIIEWLRVGALGALSVAVLASARAQQEPPQQPATQQHAAPAPDTPKLPPQQPVMPPAPGDASPQSAQIPMVQADEVASPFTLSASETGSDAPAVTEDELRQQLQGKTFYLRGGYLENTLHFDEHGRLYGSSPQASYTLSLVQIDHVRLDKKRLELEGVRYGLHFLGASPIEDQAIDKVRLTTKKKPLRILIAREQLVKAKQEKDPRRRGPMGPQPATSATLQTRPPGAAPVAPPPEEERRGGIVTTSQAHANKVLQTALDRVFSAGIDEKMVATLPDYWKLYFKSLSARQNFRPADSSILRQSQVDRKAKLLSAFEPPSNEYAQKNGVAGIAMYHVIVGPTGKAQQIVVARPIGFGLDENAVNAIKQASFQPAMKDGKPVPVLLDLVVQFRIFSKRTAAVSNQLAKAPGQQDAPVLPGPYTANAPRPPAPEAPAPAQPDQPQSSAPQPDHSQAALASTRPAGVQPAAQPAAQPQPGQIEPAQPQPQAPQ